MLLNWVILLPLSLAAICPLERHQVCNLIAADDAEHVRENRHRCTCAITALSDRPPPEQSCTNFITLDEEEKTFPVVSITFNLKESPELDAFPEESFRDTIAGALRVNQDNILILRVNCKGTKDTLTVQFGVLKPQSVAELKKKPKKRTVKGGKSDDGANEDEDGDEEEEEKDDNEGEDEPNDAKADDKNTKNGRKHNDDDDDDEEVKGNAGEDDDDDKEDEGRDDGDDDKNDDDKATVSKIKKHGRKHTKIEAKKSKDEKSRKPHKDIVSVKKDDKKNNGEDDDVDDDDDDDDDDGKEGHDDDDDGKEGDDDDDDDGKHKSIGEKDDDKDDGRKHKTKGRKDDGKDDDEDDDEDDEKVHKKKKTVKGKSKHRHDDDDDKKDDEDNEDDVNDDDDEEESEKYDEDDEDEEEEDEKTNEKTEEEKDDDDGEEEEEEEGEIDYEKVKYVADQFLDAQSIATRMKAMGHLNQIADLQVDSIEFTEDIIEIEYNPDNSALIVQTASAGGLFLFFLIIGTWCMWRRNMFDYSDDLQKV